MRAAELVVVHAELGRVEQRLVRLAGALHHAGAPAAVEQLPAVVLGDAAVGQPDGVPGVVGVEGGQRRAGREAGVAEAFAVAADDEGL